MKHPEKWPQKLWLLSPGIPCTPSTQLEVSTHSIHIIQGNRVWPCELLLSHPKELPCSAPGAAGAQRDWGAPSLCLRETFSKALNIKPRHFKGRFRWCEMLLAVTGIDVKMCDQLWVTEAKPEARTQLRGDTGMDGSHKQLSLRSWGSDEGVSLI